MDSVIRPLGAKSLITKACLAHPVVCHIHTGFILTKSLQMTNSEDLSKQSPQTELQLEALRGLYLELCNGEGHLAPHEIRHSLARVMGWILARPEQNDSFNYFCPNDGWRLYELYEFFYKLDQASHRV